MQVTFEQTNEMGYEGTLIGSEGQLLATQKREGEGKQLYSAGELFEGYFVSNQIIKGRFYFNKGDIFEGAVADNFKLLEGKYSSKTWNYTGGFKTTAIDGWLGRYYTFTFEG